MSDIPPDLIWERAAPPDATGPGPWIEIAFGAGDDGEAPVYIRETSDPENVVTTNRRKWDAFVLGVQAGEFDHFVEGVEDVAGVKDGEGADGENPADPTAPENTPHA
ncbi:DUF397 domain-containing protein [Streptomyces sp. NPDC088350]|uniref:DUF397 domain-containing protein n=1 Tax=Streptomyces sp. NPDC088350 TaxID=3365854 RepID=UPI00381A657B